MTTVAMDSVLEFKAEESEIDDKVLLETKFAQMTYIMEEMPTKDKAILLMKYQDGMSINEISKLTEKSESAVKMQIKRAKQKFMKLKDNIYPAEAS